MPSSMLTPLLVAALAAERVVPVHEVLDWVPRDALMVVHAPDFGALRASLERNAFWGFLAEDLGAALGRDPLDVLGVPFGATAEELEWARWWRDHLARWTGALDGELAAYQVGSVDEGDATYGALARLGEDAAAQLIDDFAQRLDLPVVERDGSRSIRVAAEDDLEFAILQVGDRLAWVASEVSECVDREKRRVRSIWAGEESSGFTQAPRWREARAAIADTGGVYGWLDLGVALAGVLPEVAEQPADADGLRPIDVVRMIGFDRMTFLCGQLSFGEGERLDLDVAVGLPEGGLLADVFDHLGGLPLDLTARVPADVMSASISGFDLAGAYDLLIERAAGEAPVLAGVVAGGVAAASEVTGVDLEDRLVRDVRRGTVSVQVLEPIVMPEGASFEQAEAIADMPHAMLVGVRDAGDAEETVLELVEAAERFAGARFDVDDFEVGGRWLQRVSITDGVMEPVDLFWGVDEGERGSVLGIGKDREWVVRVLDGGPGSSLVDDARTGPILEANRDAWRLDLVRTGQIVALLAEFVPFLMEYDPDPDFTAEDREAFAELFADFDVRLLLEAFDGYGWTAIGRRGSHLSLEVRMRDA